MQSRLSLSFPLVPPYSLFSLFASSDAPHASIRWTIPTVCPFAHAPPFPSLPYTAQTGVRRGTKKTKSNTVSGSYDFDDFLRALHSDPNAVATTTPFSPPPQLSIPSKAQPTNKALKTKLAKAINEVSSSSVQDDQKWFSFFLREAAIIMGILPDDSAAWVPESDQPAHARYPGYVDRAARSSESGYCPIAKAVKIS
ncbi:hypothetical protein JCM11641_000827 [Rhodosporidiobolus odoratus]